MRKVVRVQAVEVLEGFHLRLTFTDNTQKTVDVEPFLRGPMFDPVREDRAIFCAVRVDPRAGTIVWPNGADVDPDVLYGGLRPAWMEDEAVATGLANGIE